MARAASVALALIAGCAAPPQRATLYGEPLPEGCTADGPAGDERCMAVVIDRAQMLDRFEYSDPELARYVASVGERLARAAGDRRAWTFHVMDEPETQASANVGPIIYITRGAIARVRDEAELAGILAHEIGHVLGGHAREWAVENARGVRGTNATLVNLRDDEIQADDLSVLISARAGYDVQAIETMQRALSLDEVEADPTTYDDPHPPAAERIARIRAFAGRFHGGERRAAEFLAHVRGIVVGHDPRNTAVVGNAVVFSRLGLAIDLPRGWTVADLSDAHVTVHYPNRNFSLFLKLDRPGGPALPGAESVRSRGLQLEIWPDEPDIRAAFAHEVRARVRPVRADELARLAPPTRVDFDAPRVLWPDTGTTPSTSDMVSAPP